MLVGIFAQCLMSYSLKFMFMSLSVVITVSRPLIFMEEEIAGSWERIHWLRPE